MTDYTGLIIRRPALSIPVLPDGEPVTRTVLFTRSRQYADAFRRASGIAPRARNLIPDFQGRHIRGLSYDDTDVVFYDWSERDLTSDQRWWFNSWCALSRNGCCYSRGEAAALIPNIVRG